MMDTLTYEQVKVAGEGSFGVVFLARIQETDELVAIKKVLQDRRYRNREHQIMRQLSEHRHPNIVHMLHSYFVPGSNPDEIYLNLVLEYVPATLAQVIQSTKKAKERMHPTVIKLYAYQIFRSLAQIHGLGICHRDLKPQNILVDPATHTVKLCDFGSAKALVEGEPNVAYICSRYYRAPELIFGAQYYTSSIDVWSVGCIMAEMVLLSPIFAGQNSMDQIVEIIKVLGSPTMEQMHMMNPAYTSFNFPHIRPNSWERIFAKYKRPLPDLIDLVDECVKYETEERIPAVHALVHPYFASLASPDLQVPYGEVPSNLFAFTRTETMLLPELEEKMREAYGDGVKLFDQRDNEEEEEERDAQGNVTPSPESEENEEEEG